MDSEGNMSSKNLSEKMTPPSFYLPLQDEILKLLLAGKDSKVVSRKLGYKFNQIERWKKHTKKWRWGEFVKLCFYLNIDLGDVLEQSFGVSMRTQSDVKKVFLKMISGQSESKRKLSARLRKSRSSIYRRTKLNIDPDFLEVLQLIATHTNHLPLFLENLKQKAQGAHQKSARNPLSIPWLGAVSAAMAHKDHLALPHFSLRWISKKIHHSESNVQLAIDVMIENEMIEWNGTHYQPTQSRTMIISHKRKAEDYVKSISYWMDKSKAHLQSYQQKKGVQGPSEPDHSAFFRVFRASSENVEQIEIWAKEFEEKIHNLLMSTESDKNEIRCFLWSHFNVATTNSKK